MFHKICLNFQGYRDRIIRGAMVLPDGCWEWNKNRRRTRGGGWYGRLTIRLFPGKSTGCWAHRVSWIAFNEKDIPKGYEVDHLCGFTLCVNPKHLEPKTSSEHKRSKI